MATRVTQCALCGFLSPSLDLHISHLRLVHSADSSFYVRCDFDGCLEEFRAFSAYNSHIYRKHRVALGLEKPVELEVEVDTGHQSDYLATVELPYPGDSNSEQQLHESGHQWCMCHTAPKAYTEQNAEFLMSLTEGKQLSQAAIEEVIEGCRRIHNQAVSQYRQKINQKLVEAGIDLSIISEIEQTDPFVGLHSAHLRKKYYKKHFGYLVSVFVMYIHIYMFRPL